jgi:hypothetical protein
MEGAIVMNRIVVQSKVGNDGVLHLDLDIGQAEADKDVQVTVEPVPGAPATISAAALLQSGLIGLWADRTDIGDSHAFARRLREEAQTRRHDG